MEKFDKSETTNSVDNIKPESEIKPISTENYRKKLVEIKEQEQIEDPDKNTADADLEAALEWVEMNDTKKLEHTLDNSVVMNDIWNTHIISPAQRILHKHENMEIPQ